MCNKNEILDSLKDVYDPEIRINIVDLGLIYDVQVNNSHVDVNMTLTAPNCPASEELQNDVRRQVLKNKSVVSVNLNLIWDPPWSPDRMSEEARLELGYDI